MPLWAFVTLGICTPMFYAVGTGTNTAAAIATLLFFLSVPILYFAPTITAIRREHANRTSIVVVNIFLGWTLIGWVVALAWSYSAKPEASPVGSSKSTDWPPARRCPFCAEEVRVEAIKCKHCGSELPPVAASRWVR